MLGDHASQELSVDATHDDEGDLAGVGDAKSEVRDLGVPNDLRLPGSAGLSALIRGRSASFGFFMDRLGCCPDRDLVTNDQFRATGQQWGNTDRLSTTDIA